MAEQLKKGQTVKWNGREGVNTKATWIGVILEVLVEEDRVVVKSDNTSAKGRKDVYSVDPIAEWSVYTAE